MINRLSQQTTPTVARLDEFRTIGNDSLVRELQEVMTQPYAEQSIDVEEKYYRLKSFEFFETGGLSHYSCSS
jgi:hypothetical protein